MSPHRTIEDELRERLDRATSDVAGAPDLGSAITGGRRRRALRHGGALVSTVAGVGVIAVAAVMAVGAWQSPVPGDTGPAAAPAAPATDRVPGSTVDEVMTQVVADHVARAGTATDVFPSDWTRSTPLPDAQVDRATEWQAHYRVDGDETLTVLMSQRPTDAPAGPRVCEASGLVVDGGDGTRLRTGDVPAGGEVKVVPGRSAQGAGACVSRQTSSGTLVLIRDGSRTTATLWRTADATVVSVSSVLSSRAAAQHRVTDGELEAVATDPRLAFAHVADPPAWPRANGPGWPAGL